jgi:hypothetical protein
MTNADIAIENNINYNTTRKIVSIYHKEQEQREKAKVSKNSIKISK